MVGVITLPSYMGYNYGGILQNYALVSFLNVNGIPACNIECNAMSKKDVIRLFLYDKCKIGIWNKDGRVSVTIGGIEGKKNKKFKTFIEDNIPSHSYTYFSKRMCEQLDGQFDHLIVGSDQVWNPYFYKSKHFFYKYLLEFVPSNKRVAYAASFGIAAIPENATYQFQKGLSNFNAISVREESGRTIIADLIGREVEAVVDPTMLLSAAEWRMVSKKSSIRGRKPYLLKYFLGQQSNERMQSINAIAKLNGLEVYELLDEGNEELFTSGPDEFLDLVDHAALVCTDSFHATVFSILFEKPFLVMERTEENTISMSGRISTLLKKLGLEHRMPGKVGKEEIFNCDYSQAYEALELEKTRAHEFLKNAVGEGSGSV